MFQLKSVFLLDNAQIGLISGAGVWGMAVSQLGFSFAARRGRHAQHDLAHPYLSPLFGDFAKGLPPTPLQTGTRDLFLSNAVRMHRKMRAAGVRAELHVFEAMPHGGFGRTPEDEDLAAEVRRFVASLAS